MRTSLTLIALACCVHIAVAKQAASSSPASGISAQQLGVEYLADPIGIDRPDPRFSWTLAAVHPLSRNVSQSAYRILVASSPSSLAQEHGDVWDTGRIESPTLFGIRYAGRPLASHTAYFWKLRVWDQQGRPSAWSSANTWTTGLLHSSDWRAHWIAAQPDGPLQPLATDRSGSISDAMKPLPIFRRAFTIDKPVRQAIVYVAGLGQYELRLDGADVTSSVLNPGWTEYRKTVLYNAWDVTSRLRAGTHCFGVLLGNGMYNVPGIRGRYTKYIGSFGQPKLILQMYVRFADGTEETLVSDAAWKTTPGPIVFSSTYGGEDYDARRNPAGWDRPGFDDHAWAPALEVHGPNGEADPGSELRAQLIPPIVVNQIFRPVHVTQPRPGITVYDLGQNFAGWPSITVRGHAGDVVSLLPGELLESHGMVTQASANAAPGRAVLFTYTLDGSGTEVWHPRFSYYGFRYVQVTRTPGPTSGAAPPAVLALHGEFIHDAAHQDGQFSTAQPLLDRIHHLIDRAILSNMVSVLTDCPTREKLGWLEQTHLAATSIMYNYDVVRLYEKMAGDMQDSQLPDGLVPGIAPEYVAFVDRNGDSNAFRDSPEWGSAVILSPWAAYVMYGDRDLLAEHYSSMQRYAAYLQSKAHDGILDYGLGDWYDIGPNPPGVSQLTSKAVTATAIYDQDLQALAQIARLLGRSDDSSRYTAEAEQVSTAFNRRFFHPDTNQYDRGSQTANAMPLVLGMVPPDRRQAVLDHLIDDIRAHNNHVTAGDVGFHYVVRALTDAGRSDVLLSMLLRTDSPSYGYQLARGATSLTEAWDSSPHSSQNHFMLGHAEEWFYRGLAGIQFDLSRPPGEQIVIHPALLAAVPAASARYESVLGTIVSQWKHVPGAVELDVQIPPGAAALLQVPLEPNQSILENGRPLSAAQRTTAGLAAWKTGSGEYHFTIR